MEQDRNFGHAKILMDLKNKFAEMEMPEDRVETTFCFESNFKTSVPKRSEWAGGTPPLKADVTIYKDGSKTFCPRFEA